MEIRFNEYELNYGSRQRFAIHCLQNLVLPLSSAAFSTTLSRRHRRSRLGRFHSSRQRRPSLLLKARLILHCRPLSSSFIVCYYCRHCIVHPYRERRILYTPRPHRGSCRVSANLPRHPILRANSSHTSTHVHSSTTPTLAITIAMCSV